MLILVSPKLNLRSETSNFPHDTFNFII
uniref:Uncharacterized protein n=1 Tax=Vitis vinifera TaxID=29760 RepID=F6I3A2_VITVI